MSLLANDEVYDIVSGFKKVIESAKANFCESVDVAINLNINSSKSDEQVRGAVVLPKGLGREVKVAVFAKGGHLDAAKEAMADIVGDEELIEEIKRKKCKLDVDWCLTTPDFMSSVSSIAKILGPRGLMPNPKFNTVTFELSKAIKVIKSGQIRFKSDKAGIVHAKIGNVKFSIEDLLQNFNAVIGAIKQSKPASVKGVYFKNVFIVSTMGKSVKVESLNN
ncbi:50S ribosomal protein L1 [Ehrlichia ruminantium]|uniref:Large ribosomal subunit protein uL1 n=1 Tax=Ehrlichia ruminantium TaxID=779 RepID=A0A170TXL1_EHRRU|nr:50S ribosomal protein L1 [Ehrlichia ruminantium]GAT76994.1 50S ribosomal protein L1 [Ehrlichia ruminantium]GAT78030.1 50S ribosomal protein L1 [Ehrlichia ruminantium]GAT79191.1 50S ribosomal protein L1 [Ehrlichia ruminantium]